MCYYNDLVDNVATLMKYWYEDYVSDCYNNGISAPTPRGYVISTDSMTIAIKTTLTSNDSIMCVVTEHIGNPWEVMNGEKPDYDGDDAFTRFWDDCANAFYDEVNREILAMLDNDHWND